MRKKRIIFCTEATFLNTGYSTYTREILNYLQELDLKSKKKKKKKGSKRG